MRARYARARGDGARPKLPPPELANRSALRAIAPALPERYSCTYARLGSDMDSKTILLVEDNFDNRMIYRTILEHSGYKVVEAVDGRAGLDSAREVRPDLILLDVSIPIIDGWEVTRQLKGDPDTSWIPIIAITAHALATDRDKARAVGCDGYLAKPIEPRRVVEEVQRFLAAAEEAGGPES